MKIGFVGLGVMGGPMAGHLADAGHELAVFNRTDSKASQWVQSHIGRVAPTPREAARDASIICLCVGNDDDVRSVCLGEDGVFAGAPQGAIIVDHTTVSAELAREMAALAAHSGLAFLDAPVSGGQVGAESGNLTIMVGGDREVYQRAEPVLQTYARCVKRLGDSGAGQLAKMVNQVCIAGVVQGLAEGMLLAERSGLDTATVIEVISQGAAQSWQMENRYRSMLANDYDHGFAVDWMRKDLAIVMEEAHRLGLQLPVTELVDGFYGDVQGMGGGRWDTSSLFARLRKQHQVN